MFSHTILKTMYCTISNRRSTTRHDHKQQDPGQGQNQTWLQHRTNLVLPSSCQHPKKDAARETGLELLGRAVKISRREPLDYRML